MVAPLRHESRVLPIETPQFPVDAHPNLTSNFDRATYLRTIERAIEYIHAGDCFQVNIAQRLLTQASIAPLDLYEKLRTAQPGAVRRLFRSGRSRHPQRIAGAISARRGGRGRDAADQGNAAARQDGCRRSTARPGIAAERQGSRGKRHDRRSVAQRSGPRLRIRQRARRSAVPARKLSSSCIISSRKCAADCVRVWDRPICCVRRFPADRSPARRRFARWRSSPSWRRRRAARTAAASAILGFDGSMDTNLLIRTFV